MHCCKKRHCENFVANKYQFYICIYILCHRRPTDRLHLNFLFLAETDVLVPVFSQSTDVVVVNFVVVLKFPITEKTTYRNMESSCQMENLSTFFILPSLNTSERSSSESDVGSAESHDNDSTSP